MKIEFTKAQINVIEILEGEGLSGTIARRIAIETNGDLIKARLAASNYRYQESLENKR